MARNYVLRNPPPLEVRIERSRKAAAARNSLENHLSKVIAQVGKLTEDQRTTLLAALSQPAGE